MMTITNIDQADYAEGESERDSPTWRYLDLSGEHLGVRIEELSPGAPPATTTITRSKRSTCWC
jgi:hypothetical protein